MSPGRSFTTLSRRVPLRSKLRVQCPARAASRAASTQCRWYSNAKDVPAADRTKREDAKPLEHVSEEKAAVAEAMGEEGPDLTQGTPVEEILKGDKEAQSKLPKVMQDKLRATSSSSGPKGSRSYSTMLTRNATSDKQDLSLADAQADTTVSQTPGLKFPAPTLPLPRDGHLKYRYDPLVEQVTNLLMRHGKKSVAQRNMSLILQHLRTSPIPTINPAKPLLPGAPPPSHLPLNPILYLTLAIDSVAPLLRIRSQRGAAGGGVALQMPVPLGLRQRRRTAVQWIVGAAEKKRNSGSGKGNFAQRIAQELIAVVEGRSAIWDRRNAIHKLGVSARANIVLPRRR